MSDNAAMDGAYADFKIVKTRSVCQLIVEIPIERAEEAIRTFGIPQPGKEIPVALALLKAPPKAEANAAKSEQGRVRYLKMPEWQKAATRAVLLCKDKRFWQWIDSQSPDDWCDSEEKAADAMRLSLNIKSRKDIASEERAYREFIKLESEFRAATGQMAEVRG